MFRCYPGTKNFSVPFTSWNLWFCAYERQWQYGSLPKGTQRGAFVYLELVSNSFAQFFNAEIILSYLLPVMFCPLFEIIVL